MNLINSGKITKLRSSRDAHEPLFLKLSIGNFYIFERSVCTSCMRLLLVSSQDKFARGTGLSADIVNSTFPKQHPTWVPAAKDKNPELI